MMNAYPDWDRLRRQFYLTDRPHEESIYQISFNELSTATGMKSFLEFYAPRLGTTSLQPAATFFCSWLMGLPLAVQYYLSVENKGIQLQSNQLTLHMYMNGPYCQFAFETSAWNSEDRRYDQEQQVEEAQFLEAKITKDARSIWRYEILSHVYSQVLRPLVESMAEITGLHVRILWRQLPARYFYYIEQWKKEVDDKHLRVQLDEDMNYLLADLPGEVFGLTRNPLNVEPRYTINIQKDGKSLIRSACCLYHELDNGEYCFNCPKISESVREEKRLAYQMKESTS